MTSPKKRRFLPLRRRFKATPPARCTFIPGEPSRQIEATLIVTTKFDRVEFDSSKWNDVVPESAKIESCSRHLEDQTFSVLGFEKQLLFYVLGFEKDLSRLLTCAGIKHSITSQTDSNPFGATTKITARWSTPEKVGGMVERPIGQKLASALKA